MFHGEQKKKSNKGLIIVFLKMLQTISRPIYTLNHVDLQKVLIVNACKLLFKKPLLCRQTIKIGYCLNCSKYLSIKRLDNNSIQSNIIWLMIKLNSKYGPTQKTSVYHMPNYRVAQKVLFAIRFLGALTRLWPKLLESWTWIKTRVFGVAAFVMS